MADQPKSFDPKAEFVLKVARETGITEAQVLNLISLVGHDYGSILREARILKMGSEPTRSGLLRNFPD
jgi:hypothetical protein